MKPILDFFGKELQVGDYIVYVDGNRNPELQFAKIAKIADSTGTDLVGNPRPYMNIIVPARTAYSHEDEAGYTPNISFVIRPHSVRLMNLEKIIKIDESQITDEIALLVLKEGITIPVEQTWQANNIHTYNFVDHPELKDHPIHKLKYVW